MDGSPVFSAERLEVELVLPALADAKTNCYSSAPRIPPGLSSILQSTSFNTLHRRLRIERKWKWFGRSAMCQFLGFCEIVYNVVLGVRISGFGSKLGLGGIQRQIIKHQCKINKHLRNISQIEILVFGRNFDSPVRSHQIHNSPPDRTKLNASRPKIKKLTFS